MKIKKEFIPLILNGQKRYEFRNSSDKEGVYVIGNQVFKLTLSPNKAFRITKVANNTFGHLFHAIVLTPFSETPLGLLITKEEYEWFNNNENYWKDKEIYVYDWELLSSWKPLTLKELEILE